MTADDLPIGLRLVARQREEEATMLRMADAYEAATRGSRECGD